MMNEYEYLEYWATREQLKELKIIKNRIKKILQEIDEFHQTLKKESKEIKQQTKNFLFD